MSYINRKKHKSVVTGNGLAVKVIKNKAGEPDINFAIKSWKLKVKKSGILKDLSERQEYIKPSVVKRKQKQDAVYRQKKDNELE